MKNEVTTITGSAKVYNSDLLNSAVAEITMLITKAAVDLNNVKINIAETLGKPGMDENAKAEGFKSVADFAQSAFGWSRSNAFAYVQVGKYIAENKPLVDAKGTKFNFTQLRAMAGTKDLNNLTEAVNDGRYSADMSEDELIEQRNNINPKRKKTENPPKQYTFYKAGRAEAIEVTDKAGFIEKHGEPFHEFKKDGNNFILYLNEKGKPELFYYGKEVLEVEVIE